MGFQFDSFWLFDFEELFKDFYGQFCIFLHECCDNLDELVESDVIRICDEI